MSFGSLAGLCGFSPGLLARSGGGVKSLFGRTPIALLRRTKRALEELPIDDRRQPELPPEIAAGRLHLKLWFPRTIRDVCIVNEVDLPLQTAHERRLRLDGV